MKSTTKAITATLATAALSLAAAFTIVAYQPKDSADHLDDTKFEQCVRDAVTSEYPDAKGGVVRAANRAPGYQEFGDMLHFRERGLSTVNSVSVSEGEDGGLFVMAGTRKAPVVLPSSIFPQLSARTERGYFTSASSGEVPPERAKENAETEAVKTQHDRVIGKVLACGNWKN
jgi:hypothetical protein